MQPWESDLVARVAALARGPIAERARAVDADRAVCPEGRAHCRQVERDGSARHGQARPGGAHAYVRGRPLKRIFRDLVAATSWH